MKSSDLISDNKPLPLCFVTAIYLFHCFFLGTDVNEIFSHHWVTGIMTKVSILCAVLKYI